MKKYITFVLAAVLCLGTAGCTQPMQESVQETVSPETSTVQNIPENIVSDMTIGWNLGNTLDVCAADRNGDGRLDEAPADGEKVDETLWGNVKTTPELFTALREDGINAVRIPVTWRDHLGEAPDYTIDAEWLDRVHEVVDYAMDAGMYVILNVHHDGGGDPKFGAWIRNAAQDYETFEVKYTALWTQIAESFQDYPETLIFESMNEVGFDNMARPKAYTLLNTINQLFVDIVRQSGGNNAERHLLIAGYWTDTAMTCTSLYQLPKDTVENRLIVSVHYYTPWQFCTTNQRKFWGSGHEVDVMEADVQKLKSTFVDNGIPVIIGEYGTGGGNDAASRVYFCEMLTKLCHDIGIPCFFWDNGEEFDRVQMEWRTEGLIDALNRAVSGDAHEVTKLS